MGGWAHKQWTEVIDTRKMTYLKATRGEQLRSALELAIEDSIVHVFGATNKGEHLRDARYGRSVRRKVSPSKWPAMLLVGFYLDYGCDVEDLACELELYDFRERNQGYYPGMYCFTIARLYIEYRNLMEADTVQAGIFRAKKNSIENIVNKKLASYGTNS